MKTISTGTRLIGENQPTYIIAEISANHGQRIEKAKEIIHLAKEAGADCIKIQTYTADTITINCSNPYFSIDKGLWNGENLYSLYQKAYTPWEWQEELKEEAEHLGLDFFSTPFDKTAVDFLESIHVGFYKVASFELVDIPLIRYIAKTGKPMIMSTGMAEKREIQEAVEAAYAEGNTQIALLKCSSAYPAITDEMNLATIKDMADSFKVPVGLSDHSAGFLGAVTAIALGAKIIEKHICISRKDGTPDSAFSMEPEEFKEMVNAVRATEKACGKVSYGPQSHELENLKFRRSLFVVKDMEKGEVFTEDNIRSIRPADGLSPKYYESVLGKRASKGLLRGTPLREDAIEGGI